jgi:DtxR family Mn-dependent transcriptional regulator
MLTVMMTVASIRLTDFTFGPEHMLNFTYPTFVIECEGANIALDREIAEDICVWKKPGYSAPKRGGHSRTRERKKRGWFRGLRFRDKEK